MRKHSFCDWFQYMLLLRGATIRFFNLLPHWAGFNTCSSCEEQLCSRHTLRCGRSFNTCSSCEEQPRAVCVRPKRRGFNTCSSCEEQLRSPSADSIILCFNTCSSCEEQQNRASVVPTLAGFQYMLLLRGATVRGKRLYACSAVSIHAPLARSNLF